MAVTGGLVANGEGANVPLNPDASGCGGEVAPPPIPVPMLGVEPNPGGGMADAGEPSGMGTGGTPADVGVAAFEARAIGGAPELNSAHLGHLRLVSSGWMSTSDIRQHKKK
jgi:hypothetical protein